MRKRLRIKKDAELDITSFMNLMIILVPVLLMSMVFSHITVLELKLPDLSSTDNSSEPKDLENETLELVILPSEMVVNFPAGVHQKSIPNTAEGYDYKLLTTVLKEMKRQLSLRGVKKRDILILSQPNTSYQTLVSTMDTVRSYKAVQVASVVDAELFPEISLGDAPVSNDTQGGRP